MHINLHINLHMNMHLQLAAWLLLIGRPAVICLIALRLWQISFPILRIAVAYRFYDGARNTALPGTTQYNTIRHSSPYFNTRYTCCSPSVYFPSNAYRPNSPFFSSLLLSSPLFSSTLTFFATQSLLFCLPGLLVLSCVKPNAWTRIRIRIRTQIQTETQIQPQPQPQTQTQAQALAMPLALSWCWKLALCLRLCLSWLHRLPLIYRRLVCGFHQWLQGTLCAGQFLCRLPAGLAVWS